MAKAGEKTYFGAIGEASALNTLNKPFVGGNNGALLSQIGAIMTLLPNPPLRVLDLGCGTGWTSVMLAKRGYDVVGQDISEEAITLARANQLSPHYKLSFVASDYEGMGYKNEFDAAVFFDCLHHAEDEVAALRSVHKALRPGGLVIISEPGKGHATSTEALEAVTKYGVTERDMPPKLITPAARAAGFRDIKVLPDIGLLHKALYKSDFSNPTIKALSAFGWFRFFLSNYLMVRKHTIQGIVVLRK